MNGTVRLPSSSFSRIYCGRFNHLTQFTSLTLTSNVTQIDSRPFWDCTNLATITFAEGLTLIGSSAFQNTAVTSIAFPNSLTDIYAYSFADIETLTSVTFGTNFKSLGNNAFDNCALSGTVDLSETKLESVGSDSVNGSFTTVKIPSTTKKIAWYAFDTSASSFNIYYGGTITTWLQGPDGSAAVPSGVITQDDWNLYISSSKVTKIVLTDGSYTSIPAYAFAYNISLEQVEFRRSTITSIGAYAFAYTDNLKLIYWPGTVSTSVGDYAFHLSGSNYSSSSEASQPKVFYENSATSVMPSNWKWYNYFGVTYSSNTASYISSYYCWDSITLKTSVNSTNITIIGAYFFREGTQTGLTNEWIETFNATSITTLGGDGTFSGATALTTINMTSLVFDKVVANMFLSCGSLTTISFGNTSYTAGSSVNKLPAGVTSIESLSFGHCGLKTLTMNYLVTNIVYQAFYSSSVNNIYYAEAEVYKDHHMTIATTGNETILGTSSSGNATWHYQSCGHKAREYSYSSVNDSTHTRYVRCHYCSTNISSSSQSHNYSDGVCTYSPSFVSGYACSISNCSCRKSSSCSHTCEHSSQTIHYKDIGNDSKHYYYYTCDICDSGENENGLTSATEIHTYNSSCVCSLCSHTCGHSNKTYNSQTYNTSQHWDIYDCPDCGDQHTYNHTNHSMSWVTTDSSTHWKACSGCDYTSDHGSHSWGNYTTNGASTHNKTCGTCGKVVSESHTFEYSYQTYSSSDTGSHWDVYKCKYCTQTENRNTTSHSLSTDGTSTHSCSGCDYSKAHTFEYSYQDYSNSATGSHWDVYKCKYCTQTENRNTTSHNLSWVSQGTSGCRQECSGCSYKGTTTTHDLSWVSQGSSGCRQECSRCSYYGSTSAHGSWKNYSSNGSSTHNKDCGYCGYTTSESHDIAYSDAYDSDAYHKKYCTLCSYYTTSDHTYSGGVCQDTGCGH